MKHVTIKFVKHQYIAFTNAGEVVAVNKVLPNLRSALLMMGYTFVEKFSQGGVLMDAKARKRVRNLSLKGLPRLQTGEPIHSQLSSKEIAAKYGEPRYHKVSWKKGQTS
jgi:hypothetical protein